MRLQADPRNEAAGQAFRAGDWPRALALAQALVRDHPDQDAPLLLAGLAALRMGQAAPAVDWFDRATRLRPGNAGHRTHLARALVKAGRRGEAVAVADQAMALAPGDAAIASMLGMVYHHAREYAKALAAYRRVVGLRPGDANAHFNLGTGLALAGDPEAAANALETCLDLDSGHWQAHLALAEVRTQDAGSNHVARLERLLDRAGEDPRAEAYLNLALSKEYDDLGDHLRAFQHLLRGKRAASRERGYSIERDRAMFDALRRAWDASARHGGEGCDSDAPIFVVGLPRSGTTLVERVLGRHPQVAAAGELQEFPEAFKRATGSRTAGSLDEDTLERVPGIDWSALGRDYLAHAVPRTGGRPRFVDKLPHNFLFAGFIARAFPRATILCMHRHPMAVCLGNFRQLFAPGAPGSYYDYSYDLLDTGRYYILFRQLMAFWHDRLPGRIFDVSYEELVREPGTRIRQLLDACSLPWDEACLAPERSDAAVATASTLQVRRPISSSGIDAWKRHEAQLAPLRELLEGAGIEIPG